MAAGKGLPGVSKTKTPGVSFPGGAGYRARSSAFGAAAEGARRLAELAEPALVAQAEKAAAEDVREGVFKPKVPISATAAAYNNAAETAYRAKVVSRLRAGYEKLALQVLEEAGAEDDPVAMFTDRAEALGERYAGEADPFFAETVRELATSEQLRLTDNIATARRERDIQQADDESRALIAQNWAALGQIAAVKGVDWMKDARAKQLQAEIDDLLGQRVDNGLIGDNPTMQALESARATAGVHMTGVLASAEGWYKELGADGAFALFEEEIAKPEYSTAGAGALQTFRTAFQGKLAALVRADKAEAREEKEKINADRAMLSKAVTADGEIVKTLDPGNASFLERLQKRVDRAYELEDPYLLQRAIDNQLLYQKRSAIEGMSPEEIEVEGARARAVLAALDEQGVVPTTAQAAEIALYDDRAANLRALRARDYHAYAEAVGRAPPAIDFEERDVPLAEQLARRVQWAETEALQGEISDVAVLDTAERKYWNGLLGRDPSEAEYVVTAARAAIDETAPGDPGESARRFSDFVTESTDFDQSPGLAFAANLLGNPDTAEAGRAVLRGAQAFHMEGFKPRSTAPAINRAINEVLGGTDLDDRTATALRHALQLWYEDKAVSTSTGYLKDDAEDGGFDIELAKRGVRALFGAVERGGEAYGGVARVSGVGLPLPAYVKADKATRMFKALDAETAAYGGGAVPVTPAAWHGGNYRPLTTGQVRSIQWRFEGGLYAAYLNGEPVRGLTGSDEALETKFRVDLDALYVTGRLDPASVYQPPGGARAMEPPDWRIDVGEPRPRPWPGDPFGGE